jgi:hypothetical protein
LHFVTGERDESYVGKKSKDEHVNGTGLAVVISKNIYFFKRWAFLELNK